MAESGGKKKKGKVEKEASPPGGACAAADSAQAAKAKTSAQLKKDGNKAHSRKDYTKAVELYTKAIAAFRPDGLQRDLALLYTNRAASYQEMMKLTEAEADAKLALKKDDQFVKAHRRLADVYRVRTGGQGDGLFHAVRSLLSVLEWLTDDMGLKNAGDVSDVLFDLIVWTYDRERRAFGWVEGYGDFSSSIMRHVCKPAQYLAIMGELTDKDLWMESTAVLRFMKEISAFYLNRDCLDTAAQCSHLRDVLKLAEAGTDPSLQPMTVLVEHLYFGAEADTMADEDEPACFMLIDFLKYYKKSEFTEAPYDVLDRLFDHLEIRGGLDFWETNARGETMVNYLHSCKSQINKDVVKAMLKLFKKYQVEATKPKDIKPEKPKEKKAAPSPAPQKTPDLTRGALEKILSGGTPDRPVLQMLSYNRLTVDSSTRYRIQLSDGQHTYSSAVITKDLNQMIESGQLAAFAVVRLEKYVCCDNTNKSKNASQKVIRVEKLGVVKSPADVGSAMIGNPKPLEKSGIVAGAKKASSPPDPRESMLTRGAIEQLLAGRKPQYPVLQVIDKYPDGKEKFRFVLSDGKHYADFSLLYVRPRSSLEKFCTLLENFAVVRLDDYDYTPAKKQKDGSLSYPVLNHDNNLLVHVVQRAGSKIGEPKSFSSANTPGSNAATTSASQKGFELTRGAIKAMLTGGKPDRPVVQMLGFKRLDVGHLFDTDTRYRVLLSDGEHTYSSALLAEEQNSLITSGQLSGHPIICLEKYICVKPSEKEGETKKVIDVKKLSIVRSSASVGGAKIGNPQPWEKVASRPPDPRERILTQGAIEELVAGKKPDGPVLQILDLYPEPDGQKYKIMFSDGRCWAEFILLAGVALEMMMMGGMLDTFKVVRLVNYEYVRFEEDDDGRHPVLTISLLQNVQTVTSKIGDPEIFCLYTDNPRGGLPAAKSVLTRGAIKDLIAGGHPDHPVLQVLSFRMFHASRGPHYPFQLALSDGEHWSSMFVVSLPLSMEIMLRQVKEYAIIRIDAFEYRYVRKRASLRFLSITALEVLMKSANESGGKIRDPTGIDPVDLNAADTDVEPIEDDDDDPYYMKVAENVQWPFPIDAISEADMFTMEPMNSDMSADEFERRIARLTNLLQAAPEQDRMDVIGSFMRWMSEDEYHVRHRADEHLSELENQFKITAGSSDKKPVLAARLDALGVAAACQYKEDLLDNGNYKDKRDFFKILNHVPLPSMFSKLLLLMASQKLWMPMYVMMTSLTEWNKREERRPNKEWMSVARELNLSQLLGGDILLPVHCAVEFIHYGARYESLGTDNEPWYNNLGRLIMRGDKSHHETLLHDLYDLLTRLDLHKLQETSATGHNLASFLRQQDFPRKDVYVNILFDVGIVAQKREIKAAGNLYDIEDLVELPHPEPGIEEMVSRAMTAARNGDWQTAADELTEALDEQNRKLRQYRAAEMGVTMDGRPIAQPGVDMEEVVHRGNITRAVLYNNRCRVYMKLNKFKEAEEDIRLSIPRLEDYKPSYCFLSFFSERKESHHEVARVLVDYMLRYAFAPPPPNASEHERKYVYNNVEENGRLLALTVYHIQKVPPSAPHYEVMHRQFIELFDDLNGEKVLTSCVKHLIRADMWESLDYLVGRSKELKLDPKFLLREARLLNLILSGTTRKPDEVLNKFLSCGASSVSLLSSSEPPAFAAVRAMFATEFREDSLQILDSSLKLILSEGAVGRITNLRGEYPESIIPKDFAKRSEILAILKKHGLAAPAEGDKTKAVPAVKQENEQNDAANINKTPSSRLTWSPAYAPEKGMSVLRSRTLAESHMAAGAFPAAYASFTDAIREVQDMKIPKKERAALYAGRAAAAVGMKKWECVDKDCKLALKLNPNSVQAYKCKSYLLEARGELVQLNELLGKFLSISENDETLRGQLVENIIDCNADLKTASLGKALGDQLDFPVSIWQLIIGHLVKRKYYKVLTDLIYAESVRAPNHSIHKINAAEYDLTNWTPGADDYWLFGEVVTWLLQHGALITSFPEWQGFEGRRTSFGMLVQFFYGSSALLDYQLSTKDQFKEANYPNQDGFHYMIEAYAERPEPTDGKNLRMGAISCLRMSLKAKFGGDPTIDELKDPNSAVCKAIRSLLDEWKRDDYFGPIQAVEPPKRSENGSPPDPCDDCASRLHRAKGCPPRDPALDVYDLLCPVLEETHEGQEYDDDNHDTIASKCAEVLLAAIKKEKYFPTKVSKLDDRAYQLLISNAWLDDSHDWALILKLLEQRRSYRQSHDAKIDEKFQKHSTNVDGKETVHKIGKPSKDVKVLEIRENSSNNSSVITQTELREERSKRKFEGVARVVDLHEFLLSDYLVQSPDYREEALRRLLEAGAAAAGVAPIAHPLQAAAKKRDGSCVPLLVKYGADPREFHFTESDTPLHAALQVALTNGDSKTLECFRELYVENPDKYPFLAPEVQDGNGDTLLHIIARASIGKNKKVLYLTEYLRSWNIDPNLVNNEKKKAQDYLDPVDRRRRFLQADIGSTPTATVNGSTAAVSAIMENKTRQVVAKLNTIVDGLPELALEGEQEMSETESDNEEDEETLKSDLYDLSSDERQFIQEKVVTSLDDLPWEVECTTDVWKTLLSKRIGKELRQLIVYKIRELASGNFSASSHESLCDDLLGLRFGEVLVVWQVAIAFSGRRSEESADRKVYAEIIRIWDVIVHADRREAILKRIVGSIKRGQTSVVRKHLRGIEGGDQMTEGKRFPATFSIEQNATDNSILWSPPASSKENEYHIMKFYSFTSAMANYIYENEGSKVDFPFNVTDIEYTYVHLTPKPPSPLLILGRSGTGKTTCCLYRLWVKYQTYWHSTNQANPLIPRITNSEDDRHCDHLHQVFITKNKVLTTEVRKNFTYLSRTSAGNYEDLPLPAKLQDVEEKAFPLFMTSRQFLLLLDGSMPHPFFERDGNGLMLNDVEGWGSKEKAQTKLVLHEDEDRDETSLRSRGALQEVTYEMFAHKLWPKLRKASKRKGDDFHPSLVWMEIISFIKGSHQAVQSEEGYLTLEEYQTLGRKQAPHFTGDREEVYYVFEAYRHALKTDGYFDECDVIHNVYQRLEAYGNVDWVIHQIFVDEVQDFTQSELCVLIQACQEPDQMFFTGDTAQSIMRGVAFRFTDLKTLFHGIEERGQGQTKVTVPKHVYKLTQNYRSHAGVIRLANGIIELLKHYFPQSFDHVKRDVALFEGPRPVVFDSVEFEDLALVLRGNKRHASQIEFGAHQAIIVANEAARDHVPEELSHCLILTVYEAKGLEFDDVLLFNYFKYSEAGHEWRVVSQYLQDLASRQESETTDDTDIVQVDLGAIAPDERAHPLGFDPEKHKILISELKHLYTAVTRARVNIWIYDEDLEARKPMFEFFKARRLVDAKQTVRDGTSLEEGMFVKKSTASDWRKIGKEFYKREQYGPAAKCFKRAGDEVLHKICAAHQLALSAQSSQSDSSRRDQYLQAALQFLQCPQWRHLYDSAATCLRNGKEPLLAARVYARIGKFSDAGSLYRRCKQYDLAVDCYERADMYDLAIRLLCDQRRFQDALDAWKVYEAKVKECHQKRDSKRSAILSQHRPQSRDDKNTLSFRVAENNLMNDDIESVTHILEGLKWDTDQIADWMADKGKRKAAAALLKNKGKLLEAAARYREMNDYPSAIACLERCKDLDKAKRQLADCYLIMCRRYCSENNKDGGGPDRNPNYRMYMDNALQYFDQLRLPAVSGHCLLIEGAMSQSRGQDGALDQSRAVYSAAYEEFHKAGSDIGQLESLYQMMNIGNLEFKQEVMALRLVISVLNGLGKRSGGVYEDVHQFYGIDEGFVDKNAQTRIADLDSSLIGHVEIVKANQEIRKSVMRKLEYIVQKALKSAKERCEKAKSYLLGPGDHYGNDDQTIQMMKDLGHVILAHGVLIDIYLTEPTVRNLLDGLADFNLKCAEEMVRLLYFARPRFAKDEAFVRPLVELLHGRYKVPMFCLKADLRNYEDDEALRKLDSDCTQLLMLMYCSLLSGQFKGDHPFSRIYSLLKEMESGPRTWPGQYFHDGKKINFFRVCLRSLEDHYLEKDPHMAMITCNQFLRHLAVRSRTIRAMKPSTESLLPIWELQLMRGMLLYVKASPPIPAFVPKSYFNLLNLLDMSCGGSTKELVQNFHIRNATSFPTTIRNQLSYLCEIFLGVTSRQFNVLKDAATVKNVEILERLLTFGFILLVNVGLMIEENLSFSDRRSKKNRRTLNIPTEEILVRRIQRLVKDTKLRSPGISSLTDLIRTARGARDLTIGLADYLRENNDALMEVCWDDSMDAEEEDFLIMRAQSHLELENKYILFNPEKTTEGYKVLHELSDNHEPVVEIEDKQILDRVLNVTNTPQNNPEPEPADLYTDERRCDVCGTTFISDQDTPEQLRQQHKISDEHNRMVIHYEKYQAEVRPFVEDMTPKVQRLESVRFEELSPDVVREFYMFRERWSVFDGKRKDVETRRDWQSSGMLTLYIGRLTQLYTQLSAKIRDCQQTLSEQRREDHES